MSCNTVYEVQGTWYALRVSTLEKYSRRVLVGNKRSARQSNTSTGVQEELSCEDGMETRNNPAEKYSYNRAYLGGVRLGDEPEQVLVGLGLLVVLLRLRRAQDTLPTTTGDHS